MLPTSRRAPPRACAPAHSPHAGAKDSRRIRGGFTEDSHHFRRIRLGMTGVLCGFLKDSIETTIPLYNIKRGEVVFRQAICGYVASLEF